MEQTNQANQVHVSVDTAVELINSIQDHELKLREIAGKPTETKTDADRVESKYLELIIQQERMMLGLFAPKQGTAVPSEPQAKINPNAVDAIVAYFKGKPLFASFSFIGAPLRDLEDVAATRGWTKADIVAALPDLCDAELGRLLRDQINKIQREIPNSEDRYKETISKLKNLTQGPEMENQAAMELSTIAQRGRIHEYCNAFTRVLRNYREAVTLPITNSQARVSFAKGLHDKDLVAAINREFQLLPDAAQNIEAVAAFAIRYTMERAGVEHAPAHRAETPSNMTRTSTGKRPRTESNESSTIPRPGNRFPAGQARDEGCTLHAIEGTSTHTNANCRVQQPKTFFGPTQCFQCGEENWTPAHRCKRPQPSPAMARYAANPTTTGSNSVTPRYPASATTTGSNSVTPQSKPPFGGLGRIVEEEATDGFTFNPVGMGGLSSQDDHDEGGENPYFSVKINGMEGKFHMDTGCAINTVDTQTAERYKMTRVPNAAPVHGQGYFGNGVLTEAVEATVTSASRTSRITAYISKNPSGITAPGLVLGFKTARALGFVIEQRATNEQPSEHLREIAEAVRNNKTNILSPFTPPPTPSAAEGMASKIKTEETTTVPVHDDPRIEVQIGNSILAEDKAGKIHPDLPLQQLLEEVGEYFAENEGLPLLCSNRPKVEVRVRKEITDNSMLPWRKEIPLSHAHSAALDTWLERMTANGVIEEYITANPGVRPRFPSAQVSIFSPDPVGKRFVLTMNHVNAAIDWSGIDIDLPESIANLHQLRTSGEPAYYNSWDFMEAFHQIQLECDEEKPVLLIFFKAKGKTYLIKSLPMGIAIAPSIFSSHMRANFAKFNSISSYFDDLVMKLPKTIREGLICLKEARDKIVEFMKFVNNPEHSWKIQPKKTVLFAETITTVGASISTGSIAIARQHLITIADCVNPRTGAELRSATGRFNYYNSMVPGLGAVLADAHAVSNRDGPLDKLPEGKGGKAIIALHKAKKMVENALPLTTYDPNKTLIMFTDGAVTGLGAWLTQIPDETVTQWIEFGKGASKATFPAGPLPLIACTSRPTMKAEKAYSAYRLECAAGLLALKQFEFFLAGAKMKLWCTDHQTIRSAHETDRPPLVTLRFLEQLSYFNIKIIHVPGSLNGLADQLSRFYEYSSGMDPDAIDAVTMEDPRHSKALGTTSISGEADKIETVALGANVRGPIIPVKRPVSQDPEEQRKRRPPVIILGEPLSSREPPAAEGKHSVSTMTEKTDTQEPEERRTKWVEERTEKSGRIIYPIASFTQPRLQAGEKRETTKEQAEEVMTELHNEAHQGRNALVERFLSVGFDCPGKFAIAEQVCKECLACQRHNVQRGAYFISDPSAYDNVIPGDVLAFDLAQMPQAADGTSILMVAIDPATSYIHATSLRDKTAQSVADALRDIVYDHGFPCIWVSDNAPEIIRAVQDLQVERKMAHRTITPYNAKGNGYAEQGVDRVKSALARVCDGNFSDWPARLGPVIYALNRTKMGRTGFKAAELHFARTERPPFGYNPEYITINEEAMARAREGVEERATEMKDIILPGLAMKQREYAALRMEKETKRRRIVDIPAIGTVVLYRDRTRQSKHDPAYLGPAEIINIGRNGAITLRDNDGKEIPSKFRREELKIWEGNPGKPLEGQEVYAIIDDRKDDQATEYLVQWKDIYLPNSWVKEEDFYDRAIIRKYHQNKLQNNNYKNKK